MKLLRYFKWLYQRLTRGFSDRQLWNLDYEIAKFLAPRLRAWREKGPLSVPAKLQDRDPEKGYREWVKILNKMIFAFESIHYDEGVMDIARDEETWAKVQEGLDLFREYYFDLWD